MLLIFGCRLLTQKALASNANNIRSQLIERAQLIRNSDAYVKVVMHFAACVGSVNNCLDMELNVNINISLLPRNNITSIAYARLLAVFIYFLK